MTLDQSIHTGFQKSKCKVEKIVVYVTQIARPTILCKSSKVLVNKVIRDSWNRGNLTQLQAEINLFWLIHHITKLHQEMISCTVHYNKFIS